MIVHPNLNNVRKHLKAEFQVAMTLSSIIEEEQGVEIPLMRLALLV